ncbi:MAG: hypothetical protein ABSH33_20475 [Steroidobacteraceae bacterium]|jgi:hypothetical protein
MSCTRRLLYVEPDPVHDPALRLGRGDFARQCDTPWMLASKLCISFQNSRFAEFETTLRLLAAFK